MRRLLLLGVLLAGTLACSPEASRARSTGAGADIGNHSQTVPLHGDGVMFYRTPREGDAITK
jgi:hypothetical protein